MSETDYTGRSCLRNDVSSQLKTNYIISQRAKVYFLCPSYRFHVHCFPIVYNRSKQWNTNVRQIAGFLKQWQGLNLHFGVFSNVNVPTTVFKYFSNTIFFALTIESYWQHSKLNDGIHFYDVNYQNDKL